MMKKQLLLSLVTVLIALSAHANSGIFLRGSVNNWDASSEWEFVDEGNGVYTLTDKVLSGDFKIASADWSTVDYGTANATTLLEIGVPMTLVTNTSQNIFCSGTLNCTKITLTIPAEGEVTLFAEGTATQSKSGFYLRGDINGWGTSPEWEFIEESAGIYTLSDVVISGRFKIADSSWTIEFGSTDAEMLLTSGNPYPLVLKGGDITCADTYKCSKITVNATDQNNITLLLEGEVAGSGIFIRGGMTNWDPLPEWEFKDEGNGVYTLKDKEINGKFKVADASWGSLNYGVSGGTLQLGSLITLVHNGNDISCGDDTFICTTITFTIGADGVATLLVEGSIKEAGALTEVYIIGDNNSWGFTDASGKLSATDTEGEYQGTVEMKNASGAEVGYWRLYEGLGQVGTWGNPGGANTDAHTTTGTLERGSEGCITTAAGTYLITFNIKSGAFTMTEVDPTGIKLVNNERPLLLIDNGNITVQGEDVEKIGLYTIGGAKLVTQKGSNSISLPLQKKGIYIVEITTGGKTYKYKVAL